MPFLDTVEGRRLLRRLELTPFFLTQIIQNMPRSILGVQLYLHGCGFDPECI